MSHQTVCSTASTITVGLDLGDRFCQFCELDSETGVIAEGRLRTTAEALRHQFSGRKTLRIVMEVGTHSPWVSRLLEESGHEVLVANARRVRLIYANDSKTDKVDAETLARVGRLDPTLLAPIRHRGQAAQADLARIRARDCLVRARTQLVNHVRGAVKSIGSRLPAASTPAFVRKATPQIPESLRPALQPLLDIIDILSHQIRAADRELEALARERYPEAERLRQVAGVGVITALCYILTLEDPGRFKNGRSVGAYLGLRPRQHDSGAHSPQLRITKRGDAMLRRLLVGSAQYILGPFGPDCDLRHWGLRLAERGGKNAKKRAVVAVARKLAALLYTLWVTGADYEPLRHAA
jgi:transposase